MNRDRWHQVDQLLQSALDVPALERDGYLRSTCDGDQWLEGEVRSLLAAHDDAGSFLAAPAIDLAARELAGQHREGDCQTGSDPLIDQTLSHYRIVARLAGGGMGIVYKAEDTRLHRPVALKLVAPELSRDSAASARFAREARTASALNHPNICTIYDIGKQDGRSFIVMEYLEGMTLQERISAGPLPLNRLLGLAVQIADALEAAHSAGIVHRDIKPANIFIGARDRVSVLDFGLASSGPAASRGDGSAISHGVVMGTAAYMAPEQARGEAVDHRADIWSLGLVLYEMAKGKRPSQAVRLRVEASPEFERIVSKCLETDPELRYQRADDLRGDLERLKHSEGAPAPFRAALGRHRARWLAPGAAVIIVAAAVAGALNTRRPPPLTDKDTIVIAEYTNATGDPVFDDTLRQGLAVQLRQSPFLSLISDERIRRTLPLMNQPAGARLTHDVARVVCVRSGGAAVLQGSIAALGSQYILGLRATNCATGEILADEQAQASRKEDVLSTLSGMATRFRTRVGESLATVEKHSRPLAEATTPSLDALQAYSAAVTEFTRARRLMLLQRAVALDPEFAVAHAQLGFALSSSGEAALGRQSLIKAYQLRSRASDLERFSIETFYDRDVTGNLEREQRTLEAWAQSYPRDPSPHTLLAGLALTSTGQHELAIAEAKKAIALDPDWTPAYANMAFNQLFLNRPEDALLAIARARERKLERGELLLAEYFAAFLQGDDERLARTAAAARRSPELVDLLPHVEALALARAGRVQDARRMSAGLVEIAQQSGRRERAGLFEAGRAVWEAFYGMRRLRGRVPARRSPWQGTAMWITPRRLRWPSRVTWRRRAPWPGISRASSRRTPSFSSCTCRRFEPCSL
jgi:tetratricopeptide (TPR) repeat protein/predicted Ser/Thr protein kinase